MDAREYLYSDQYADTVAEILDGLGIHPDDEEDVYAIAECMVDFAVKDMECLRKNGMPWQLSMTAVIAGLTIACRAVAGHADGLLAAQEV